MNKIEKSRTRLETLVNTRTLELTLVNEQLQEEIIKHRKTRESLNFEHSQLISMFDGMDNLIYVSDPETYEILYMNSSAVKQWGDGIGCKCYSIIQNRDSPCPFCTYQRIFGEKIGKAHIYEYQNLQSLYWYRCMDRAIRWPDGRMVHFQVATNITDNKPAEKKIKQNEMELQDYVDSLITFNAKLDPDGRVIMVNETAVSVMGLCRFEVVGKHLGDSLSFSYDPEISKRIKELALRCKKGERINSEEKIRAKDGHLLVQFSMVPIFNEKKDVKYIVAEGQDLTTRKQAEKELLKNKDELEKALNELKETRSQMIHSEKMASIGQLAAGVAHEINNPTGFISSNLNTLSEYQEDFNRLIKEYQKFIAGFKDVVSRDNLPASILEHMERIAALEEEIDIGFLMDDTRDLIGESRDGTGRIKKIVADLKDFVHPGEDKAREVDINEGIKSTLNVVWNQLKYNATVTKDYGDLPLVKCYPQQLNQVFMNLFVNAAQAIEKRGEIKISTRAVNGNVEIKISDTGSGIAEENLSKIFNPFFTTKAIGKGTGLGLNISHNIIQKHNGTIDVESTLGKGTEFTIRLPAKKV